MTTSAAFSGSRLRPARQVLTDGVYEAVKELLMDLTIPPGRLINMAQLAKDLDVSTTPLRETLARLESEGLITKKALQGYRATPVLDAVGVRELFEVRLALESSATRLAAERRSADELKGIEASIKQMRALTARTTINGEYQQYRAFADEDARFHALVASASGNELLERTITGLNAHVHLYRLYFASEIAPETAREHTKIQVALKRGDVEGAEGAMRDHLQNSWHRLEPPR